MKNKAVFLDRDGTINIDKEYTHKSEDLEIIPGVVKGLKKLQDEGYKLIIITNQSGIGRGYYVEQDYHNFQLALRQQLNKQGIFITGEYFCPHSHDENCSCRKPKTGLLESAAKDFDIDLNESWMIGDSISDIQAGNSAGCRTILVLTGKSNKKTDEAEFRAKNLIEAANYILDTQTNKNFSS